MIMLHPTSWGTCTSTLRQGRRSCLLGCLVTVYPLVLGAGLLVVSEFYLSFFSLDQVCRFVVV